MALRHPYTSSTFEKIARHHPTSCILDKSIPVSLASFDRIDGILLSLWEIITCFSHEIDFAFFLRLSCMALSGYTWALRNSASIIKDSWSIGLSFRVFHAFSICFFESVNGSHFIVIVYRNILRKARKILIAKKQKEKSIRSGEIYTRFQYWKNDARNTQCCIGEIVDFLYRISLGRWCFSSESLADRNSFFRTS